jgi:hypothetical protein
MMKQAQTAKAMSYSIENEQNSANRTYGQLLSFKSSNDRLQEELEARYGAGFAQWLIDDLKKKKR